MNFQNNFLGIILLSIGVSSCMTSVKKICDTYRASNLQPVTSTLSLNSNKTFVQFIGGDVCGENYYFGFYSKRGNKILLRPISSNYINYSAKRDTLILNYFPSYNKKGIFVFENQRFPSEGSLVRINDSITLAGTTDENGFIEVPLNLKIETLRILRQAAEPRSFTINGTNKFNQVFIMIYDSSLVPCSDFYFVERLKIRAKGIIQYKNGRFKNNISGFYFTKYAESPTSR